jgi:hypothetical protein
MQRAASRPVAGGASLDNGSLARLFWRALDAVTTGSCRRGCGAWMRSTALSRRPRPIGSGGVIARTSRACGGSAQGRPEPSGQGSRPQRAASVSGLWKEGAGSGFGEVAGAGRLDQASGSSLRRRSGAGLGDYSRRRSLLGLVRPDRDRQARRSYAAAVNEMSAAGPGLISRLEARRSARPHHRYKVTPKSCPTCAGKL